MLLNYLKLFIGSSFIKKIYKGEKLINYNFPKNLSISLYKDNAKVDESKLDLNTPYTIKTILTPFNCINNEVTFHCSNSNAIIKGNVVTFHKTGAYKLYASVFNGVRGEIFCKAGKYINYPNSVVLDRMLYSKPIFEEENKVYSLKTDTKYYLNSTVLPNDVVNKIVTYSCDDDNVIINKNEVVFKEIGKFNIVATTENKKSDIVSFYVSAYDIEVPLESVYLDDLLYENKELTKSADTLEVNTWYFVKINRTPDNARLNNITFQYPSDIKMEHNGQVHKVMFTQDGQKKIGVKIESQPYEYTTYNIEIAEAEITGLSIKGLKIHTADGYVSASYDSLALNTWYKIDYTISADGVTDKVATFSCSNSKCIIDDDGNVTFKDYGSFTIKGEIDGHTDEYTVTLVKNIMPTALNIKGLKNADMNDMYLGVSYQIEYSIAPSDAIEDTVIFTCSNSNATISGDYITFSAFDQAYTIVGTCQISGVVGSVTVTPKKKEVAPTSMTITGLQEVDSPYTQAGTGYTYKKGKWYKILCSFTPSYTTLKDYCIDGCVGDGDFDTNSTYVKSNAASYITITMVSLNGGGKATATFNFAGTSTTTACTNITLNGISGYTDSQLELNKWYSMSYSTTPAGKSPTFTSSSSNVTISGSQVKFLAYGTYTIKATVENISRTCSITVTAKTTEVLCTGVTINGFRNSNGTLVSSSAINTGEWYTIDYTLTPSNTTDTIKFSCDDSTMSISGVKFCASQAKQYRIAYTAGRINSSEYVTASSAPATLKSFSGADDVISLARTYYDNRSKYLIYGQTNVMTGFGSQSWTSVTSTGADSPDGKYRHLDCSGLVGLCMRGIAFNDVYASKTTYENKSLAPRTSKYSWCSSMSEFPRTAQEQYDYCNNKGWLLSKTKWHSGGTWGGLKKGDLIFWHNGDKVNHVAFYYGLNSSGLPAIIECTSYSYVTNHTDYTSSNKYTYGVTIITMDRLKSEFNTKYSQIYAVARPQL